MEVIKKLLYVLGYATSKKAAHLAPHLDGKIDFVPPGQSCKAFYGGLFIPGPQFEGGEDVRLGAETRLPEDGFKANAARYDQADFATMLLAVFLSQLKNRSVALRRSGVI